MMNNFKLSADIKNIEPPGMISAIQLRPAHGEIAGAAQP